MHVVGIEQHSEPVMPKNLDQITPGAAKDVKIARVRSRPSVSCTCSAMDPQAWLR
jgi:hypothetical protein